MDRSNRIANMPEEESKGENFQSKFKSIISKKDESSSHSGIEVEIEGMSWGSKTNTSSHRYIFYGNSLHLIVKFYLDPTFLWEIHTNKYPFKSFYLWVIKKYQKLHN